jgi:hypothetical protein
MGKQAKAATATVVTVPSQGAHIAISNVEYTAPVGKYGASASHVPCAAQLFALASGDGVTFAATGRNKAGKYAVQPLVQRAAAIAGATADKAVTGLAIVETMLTNAEILEGLRHCRATKYAAGGKVPCPHWASAYVIGNASARVGLLRRAAA